MEISTDTIIPPIQYSDRQQELTATFLLMNVGDSVAIGLDDISIMMRCAKHSGIEIEPRRIGDKEFRVWRTA
jgi:hypothetical protein